MPLNRNFESIFYYLNTTIKPLSFSVIVKDLNKISNPTGDFAIFFLKKTKNHEINFYSLQFKKIRRKNKNYMLGFLFKVYPFLGMKNQVDFLECSLKGNFFKKIVFNLYFPPSTNNKKEHLYYYLFKYFNYFLKILYSNWESCHSDK